MATFQLQHLDELDALIKEEHSNWLQKNQKGLFFSKINDLPALDFGLLDFPELWTGKRVGETRIAKENLGLESYFTWIQNEIALKKKALTVEREGLLAYEEAYGHAAYKETYNKDLDTAKKDNKKEIEKLEAFEILYQDFFNKLIEKFLVRAVQITLEQFNLDAEPEYIQLKDFYASPDRSPVNLQIQNQCVAEHAKITKIIKTQRSKACFKESQKNLTQLETLSKLRVDLHYENVVKKTKYELVLNGAMATASTIGAVAGIFAAIFWVGSIFVPPLLPLATVLSCISYTAYTTTAITVGMAIKNGINGRAPSTQEKKALIIEAAMLPFNFIGRFGSWLKHCFKSKSATNTVKDVTSFANNVVGNAPDLPFVPEHYAYGRDTVIEIKEAQELSKSIEVTSPDKISKSTLAVITELFRRHGDGHAKQVNKGS